MRESSPRRTELLSLGICLALVLGVFVALRFSLLTRSPDGVGRWLSLSPDAVEYLKMVRGEHAFAPFSSRRLAPFLAQLLPLPPAWALSCITQLSFVAANVSLFFTLTRTLGLGLPAASLGVLSVMTSTRSLLILQNPYLVDGLGYLCMAVGLHWYLRERPLPFAAVSSIGVLAREDALFGAFAFLFGSRRRAGIAIASLVVIVYAVTRGKDLGPARDFVGLRLLEFEYCIKAYFAFGYLWVLGALGVWLAWKGTLRRLVPYAALTFGGALLSTAFALDTTRVFLPVLPALGVACALVFERLAHSKLLLGWVSLAVANACLALPTNVIPDARAHLSELEEWYRWLALPIVLQHAMGIALTARSAFALRHQEDAGPS